VEPPDPPPASTGNPSGIPDGARFQAIAYGPDRGPPEQRLADAEERFWARFGVRPALIAVPSGDYQRYGPLDRCVVPHARVPTDNLYLLHPDDAAGG